MKYMINRMRAAPSLTLVLALVLASAAAVVAQNTANYMSQGGAVWHIGSGGSLEIDSGGTLQIESGATFTSAVIPSYTAGLTVTGGTVNLNASSNNAVNIGTGTTTSTVTIGGSATQSIDVGTGAGAKAVTLGSATGASATTINGGTGDVAITSVDDLTLNGGSAGSIIAIGTNTQGNVFNVGTDDTTADDINVGSAKDDFTLAAEDITLTTADDSDWTSSSAGGILAIGGTPGVVINIGSDDTTADTITVGSAKDNVDLAGEDINLTSADDMHLLSGSAGGILNVLTGTAGYVFNLGTDDTTADDINVGSIKDDVDITAVTVGLTGGNNASAITLLTNSGTSEQIVLTNTQGTNGAAIDINATAGGVDIDASTVVQIDAGGAGVADDMILQVTSTHDGEDMSIAQVGAVDASILMSAAGTGTDAISLQATGGSIDVDAAGDMTLDVGDDLTLNGGSAGSIIAIGTNTQGNVLNVATDDTTADDINIGSVKDDFTVASEDITLTTADDMDLTSTSAGGIIALGGTPGVVINIGTDDTTKDTISIGSAKDDVGLVSGAGAEAAAGNVCAERCVGAICQTVCTLTAVTVAVTDPGGAAAYGGVKIYDFPAGYVNRLGIVADLTLTEASATISDTFDGDIAFGSIAAEATATLHNPTTEDDWCLTRGTTTAVASVGAADTQSAVTEQTICDGHSTACDLYLNIEIDDGSISTGGADSVTAAGTITITWINLGDNG